MPIIGRRGQPAANPIQRSFIERIKTGRVVPVLSDEALVLRGHEGEVNAVAFSLDGSWLASAGSDNTVRLWAGSAEQLIATACATVARNPTWLERVILPGR